jgi:hypothetical protein
MVDFLGGKATQMMMVDVFWLSDGLQSGQNMFSTFRDNT